MEISSFILNPFSNTKTNTKYSHTVLWEITHISLQYLKKKHPLPEALEEQICFILNT